MDPRGRHLLIEYWGCPPKILSNQQIIQSALTNAAQAAGATIIESCLHRFAQGGVSGVLVIAESHLSIHTWPEHGYAAIDFFTCGSADPMHAHACLLNQLQPNRWECLEITRGRCDQPLDAHLKSFHN